MNVYVETNFILELTFLQEQHESCNNILDLCEAGRTHLILPAFCIAEAYEALIRQAKRREQLASGLTSEIRQLSRSEPYRTEIDEFQSMARLLMRSSQDEEQRLINVLDRLLQIADIISLEAGIIADAVQYQVQYKLEPQDSIIYSSVLHHLASAGGEECCFINRNKRDFDNVEIEEGLANMRCKMLFNFDSGYNYINRQ